jgi:hypothetical protein
MGQNDQQRPQNSSGMLRGTVARGRTVEIPHGEKVVVNHTPEGRPIMRAPTKSFGPGAEVELPEKELLTLRVRGFIIDPNAFVAPIAEGPHYTEKGAHASAA